MIFWASSVPEGMVEDRPFFRKEGNKELIQLTDLQETGNMYGICMQYRT
jgi:hypothetical protein